MTDTQKLRTTWAILGSVVALAVCGMAAFVWYVRIENTGSDMQLRIVGLQQRMEESVSPCLDAGRASTRMSTAEFEPVKRVLVNVAMARYENDRGMLAADGPMVGRLHGAHPEIGVATWSALTRTVVDCRRAIDNRQRQLRTAVEEFDAWRHGRDVFGVRSDFPTADLEAIDPRSGQRVRGLQALEALSFVISGGATNAGLMPAQSVLRK